MTQPVRIGIIGAGYWGPNLIRNFNEIEQADVRTVCDMRQDRLDHIQGRYPGLKVTQDYRDLLDSEIDAVVIATPVSTHHCLTMDSLNAGKSVLVEKPLACSSSDAHEMVITAQKLGLVLLTGHIFIYNPAITALKQRSP